MSGYEIERKFLVKKGVDFKKKARCQYEIRQGYIPSSEAAIRIRLRDNQAFLTIKGKKLTLLTRYEFETEIDFEEGQKLLQMCKGLIIEKTRYLVDVGKHTFEIDEFHGLNEGLVVAEVELQSEDEEIETPDFLGKEVTDDGKYANMNLMNFPYQIWKLKQQQDEYIKNKQNNNS